jgi:hypothetical protein
MSSLAAGARTIFNTTEANVAAELAQLCSDASGLQAWLSQAMSLQVWTTSPLLHSGNCSFM